MTEETDGTIAGTEGAIAPSEVETNSEATAEQSTGAEDAGSAADAGEEAEPVKKVPWFQKRINEVTADKYEAQRQADYWRGLAEGRGQNQPQQPQRTATPPDRYEDPDGYDQWLIAQAVEKARQDFTQTQSLRTYEERAAAFKASKPDYDSVAGDPTLPVSPQMAQVIWETEKGPEILYYLGANRSEAARITALPPHLQAVALGRIEASLNAPPPATRNPPPPPPKTVAGISSGIGKSLEDMSMAEYVANMKAEGRL